MARTITQIATQMLEAKAADTNLNGLTSTSQTAIWRLWIYIVAAAINIFEQLQDVFIDEVEETVSLSAPNTPQWTKNRVERFQYDANVPQVAELNLTTFVVDYPTIDPALRIISRCSVNTAPNRAVLIKVAKNEPPEPLDGGTEYVALADYIHTWIPAGISFELINETSDKIEVACDVYYNAQYSAVIQSTVEAGINNYLANLPFDGTITTQGVVDAIQGVAGVSGVSLTRILIRRDSLAYGAGTTLYNLSTGVDGVQAATYAGYAVEEDTASHTFADTINYIVQ